MKSKNESSSPNHVCPRTVITPEQLKRVVGDHAPEICRFLNRAFGTPSEPEFSSVPAVFLTESACHLFSLLRDAGILDENNMPVRLTMTQKAVLASELAGRLNIRNKWVEFGRLWHINKGTLRGKYELGMEQKGMFSFIESINSYLTDK